MEKEEINNCCTCEECQQEPKKNSRAKSITKCVLYTLLGVAGGCIFSDPIKKGFGNLKNKVFGKKADAPAEAVTQPHCGGEPRTWNDRPQQGRFNNK